jgi:hypothetical protein
MSWLGIEKEEDGFLDYFNGYTLHSLERREGEDFIVMNPKTNAYLKIYELNCRLQEEISNVYVYIQIFKNSVSVVPSASLQLTQEQGLPPIYVSKNEICIAKTPIIIYPNDRFTFKYRVDGAFPSHFPVLIFSFFGKLMRFTSI